MYIISTMHVPTKQFILDTYQVNSWSVRQALTEGKYATGIHNILISDNSVPRE